MPSISWFYGISIQMFFNDHAPPHFHASYGDEDVMISIETGEVLRGEIPRRALRLVRDWTLLYRAELMANWERAQARPRMPMEKIPGLDAKK